MFALFGFTIRQLLFQRKIWLTLLLLAGPCAIVLLVRQFGTRVELEKVWERFHGPAQFLTFMIVVPLMCILQGSALIGAEAEGRTLVYLLTRRMRRATVLLVKFAGAVVALTILVELSLLALYACAVAGVDVPALNAAASPSFGQLPWRPLDELLCYLYVTPFAVLAFLGVFTLISLTTPKPLTASILFLLIFEVTVSNLPIGARVYSVSHYLRLTMFDSIPRLMTRMYDELPSDLGERLYPAGATGTAALCWITTITLALSGLLITTRELLPTKQARE